MERWRPETNTFHMYHGEVSITLQDVAHLTSLSVSGDTLYVEYEKETNWAAIVQEVLGKSPDRTSAHMGRDRIPLNAPLMLSAIFVVIMPYRNPPASASTALLHNS
ncbi:Serine/threonine-protein phosphatase 7 long form homolog [Linum grandiflorum]